MQLVQQWSRRSTLIDPGQYDQQMHELRLLTDVDAKEFWQFRLAALEESPHAFTESADELRAISLSATADRLRASTTDNFVVGAFVDGRMVGTAGFFRNVAAKLAHKGRVWGVYVHPRFRGRGVARDLMTDVLARVRCVNGVRQVSLTVATTQVAAVALYESLGFVRFGLEVRSLLVGSTSVDEEHRVFILDVPPTPE